MRLDPYQDEESFDKIAYKSEPASKVIRKMLRTAGKFGFWPKDFKMMLGPGVYIAWLGKTALYVGSSKSLLSRISEPSHESLRRALDEADWLELHIYDSEAIARDRETHFIQHFQPKYNVVGKSGRAREEAVQELGERQNDMAKTICVLTADEVKELHKNVEPNCRKHTHITKAQAMEWTGKGDFKPLTVPIAEWVGPKQIVMLIIEHLRDLSCKMGEEFSDRVRSGEPIAKAFLSDMSV